MQDIAQLAVDQALERGAEHAEARLERLSSEELVLRNGRLAGAEAPDEIGLGVRVLAGGTWGFAAAPLPLGEDASRARDLARDLARRATKAAADLAPARTEAVAQVNEEPHVQEWATPLEIDPFGVALEDKRMLLADADEAMKGADGTVVRVASLSLRRREQSMVTSEGSALHQVQVRTGAGVSTTAAGNGRVEVRSWPDSFGGDFKSGGWENVAGLDLVEQGRRMRDESVALLTADRCPEGVRTLILGGSQLALQIHESVGHPTELDRVFGHEVDLAGSSFATPEKLGGWRYGSEIVNLVADSTVPGGLDTRAFDDEGVASGRWHIVREGLLEAYHTSREWASAVGEDRSRGAARAESWFHPPIIRITNLSLEPGSWTFDKLLADTEDGAIFADGVRTWSIDQRRLDFQFTCEAAWEVKDGKLGRLLSTPTYQGSSPQFWGACDAICDAEHWRLHGVPNCGKGNPMQVAEMSHGASPARFRNVRFLH